MRPNLFFLPQDIFTYFLSLEGALTGLFFYLKFYRCFFILLREGLLLSKERKLLNIIIYNAPHCEWGYLDCSAGEEPTCNAGDTGLIPGSGRSAGEGIGYPTAVCLGFPCGSAGKEPTCNAGDLGSIPGLGRSPGEGKGYLLQYSSLENSMDSIVHGVTKSWTRLSDSHTIHCECLPDLLLEGHCVGRGFGVV